LHNVSRTIVELHRDGKTLRGILEGPADATGAPGVLLLPGWGGVRTGPHGILRSAAERLAGEGYLCLRFDFLGRGDSDGAVSDHDLSSQIEDAKVAAGYLREVRGCPRLALIGICSGGEVAVGSLYDGLRADAVALWSSPVFSADATFGRRAKKSASYLTSYIVKALRPSTWAKLFAGRVRFGIIKRVLLGGSTHQKKEGERAEIKAGETLAGGADHCLLLYGTADPIAEEAIERYTGLFERSGADVTLRRIEGANHGFYSGPWHAEVVARTAAWLTERVRARPA
jgi:uncharacterized protein